MKSKLIVLFFSLFLHKIYSQQYIFSKYSIENGLSQSVVNCIFQDSKGYIWIGTQNGINRFNGDKFEVFHYNPADSNSISDNWIYSITEDAEQNLWIGTKDGISKYLTRENKFIRIKYNTNYLHDVTKYGYDVFKLNSNCILINNPPLITIYEPKKNSFKTYQNKLDYDGSVKDVKIPALEDKKGNIWIASTRGISRFSQTEKIFTYYSFKSKSGKLLFDVQITALHIDESENIWAGTSTGLFKLNKTNKQFEETQFKTNSVETFFVNNICVRSIIEDKNKNLYIGTEGSGLIVISPSQPDKFIIQNYTSENSDLSHNIVQSLIIDKSENLWIGTLQGITKTDLKKKKFNLYRKNNSPNSLNLLGNVIASLYKDDEGIIWAGNWGQGLNKINREKNQVEHFSTQKKGNYKISNDFIHVIFKDKQKNIWVGTRDGILIYEKHLNQFIPYRNYFKNFDLPSFQNVRIYMIIQDKQNNFWIGTQNGLYKINQEKTAVEIFRKEADPDHKLNGNLIYCLLEDQEGLIWIATVSGLDVYNPLTKKIKHYQKTENGLCDNFVISLCEDHKNRIWIGTSSYVNMFNKKDSSFTYFSQKQGLPNNRIFEIVKDNNNNLWFATGKGLCKFEEKKNRFHTYSIEEGLQSLEFNLRAAYASKDGEVLLGGMNGFNSFYPDSIFINEYIPNLVFTSFFVTKGINKEYINIENTSELVLNYDIYSFTIEFAALEYTNPEKNKYAYKMEGISDDWTEIGNRKFVPFSALQSGEYIFKVRGSNNDDIWNENEISIKIIILSPWWKSTYAYAAYIVLVFLAIVAFIKIRERKLKQDKKNLERKVSERTRQLNEQAQLIIAKNKELHDLNTTKDKFFSIIGHDLRNPFDIIIHLSETLIAEHNNLDSKKTEYYLSNIYNSSKLAHELLENLLTWARMQTKSMKYNPEIFNANFKIIETIEFLEGAAIKKNIRIKVYTKCEAMIYADVNMFSAVIRNLISNAIKFTYNDGKISIYIKKIEQFFQFSVEDNGVGISEENLKKLFRIESKHSTLGTNKEKGTGLGLLLCKEFIEINGGNLWVNSKSGNGSKFFFTIPSADDITENQKSQLNH